VHPRTQTQGFTGRADWDLIRLVKRSVTIPVVGNGDVETPQDAKQLVDETGCDFVMIGRGALGRPWIFRQINRYLSTGQLEDDPPPRERMAICLAHFQKAVECLGEKRAVFEMRKHIGWYVKGLKGSTSFRRHVFQLTDVRAVSYALRRFTEESGPDAFHIPVNPHEYA
ncbi:MAG TPA: tRNA-dihydrouridine synthase, partial [bacterium]